VSNSDGGAGGIASSEDVEKSLETKQEKVHPSEEDGRLVGLAMILQSTHKT
jgi:hypothetical protein